MDGDKIVEDLLFCKEYEDLFEILDTLMCENNLDWTKCVGVCTDDGCSIFGCYGVLQALVRSKVLNALWIHCIIYREALASKHSSPPLNLVLEKDMEILHGSKTHSKLKPHSELTSAEEDLIDLSCEKTF
ncbi:protein FAM200A-like [Tachypleus tridentatus]|uniref:protein FAM200A-like n=1 Tax=Tachypleus tridentatus TaxID=6853 RepID=UPI003FD3E1BE